MGTGKSGMSGKTKVLIAVLMAGRAGGGVYAATRGGRSAGSSGFIATSLSARQLRGTQSVASEPRQRVEACLTPSTLEQVDEALADAKDAELLCSTLNRKRITKEESADVEAAALRRLERRKATVAKLQRLVDTGALPLNGLDASVKDVDSAVKDYVLSVTRTALIEMAGNEFESPETSSRRGDPAIERFNGDSSFTKEDWHRVLLAYEKEFGKSLPVSAQGETAVHRALGYDHRNRVDVALFPDGPEGSWLRRYLETNDIPYYAFRSSVPGKATAAHIHIGPPSSRLPRTD